MSDVPASDAQAVSESDEFMNQAIDWYVKLISQQHPPGLTEEFDSWLASDARHARAFARVTATSRLLDRAVNSRELVILRRDALEAARRAEGARRKDVSTRFWKWRSAAAAAAVLLIVALAGWWALEGARTARYVTASGQRLEVQLADGSRMWLDESTELAVHYDASRRSVNLIRGQARFDVAPERARPFAVTAGDRSIVAVGTVFNVDLLQSRLYVTLLEGRLLVSHIGGDRADVSAQTVELRPAQQLIAVPGEAPQVRAEVNLMEAIGWESGRLSFEDEPLEPAVERVNRYAQRKIVIADPRLNELRVSGVFNAGDSAAFADAIATWLPIVIAVDSKDRIILSKAQ